MDIDLINRHYSGLSLISKHLSNSNFGLRSWLSCTIISCLHVILSKVSCARGKTSNACILRNRCDAGSPKYCPSWLSCHPPPNPWKIQRPLCWGHFCQTYTLSGDSQEAFLASTCFNMIHPFFFSVPLLYFSQNRFRCSARAVCPNVNSSIATYSRGNS